MIFNMQTASLQRWQFSKLHFGRNLLLRQQVIRTVSLMGCDQSDIKQSRNAVSKPDILTQKKVDQVSKELLIQAIEKDDLVECAVIMESEGILPNSQLSDDGLFWMPPHFCCRWEAPRCLQYILKEFYAFSPRSYIKYVNAPTSDGQTLLHLCAIWGADKCFALLNAYGGLNILAKDKMNKDPDQTAKDFKRDKMVQSLAQLKAINIGFTHVDHQKLISGSILDLEHKDDQKKYQMPANNQLVGLLGNIVAYTQQQAKIRQRKLQIEKQNQRIRAEKQRIQQEAKQKRIELLMAQNLTQITKLNKQLARDDAKLQGELDQYSREILSLNQGIKDLRKKRVDQKVAQENQIIDDLTHKSEAKIAKRLQQRKSVVHIKEIEMKSILQSKKQQILHPVDRNNIEDEMKRRTNMKQKQGGHIPPEFQARYQSAKTAGLFVDNEFPANNSSIGSGTGKHKNKHATLTTNMAWFRPTEIFKSDYQLFDGIDPSDIKQGSLGVCYYLATVSVLAKNPDNIKNMFVFYDKAVGFYLLKLYRDGVPNYIAIDDQIPCSKSLKTPLFTKPIGKEIWVLLLEKAWAKCIGTYLDAEAMTPDHMMEDLVGSPSYGQWLTKEPQEKMKQVNQHDDKDHIVVLTSVADKKIEGIANNHAYSMLKSYQHQGKRIYKIRNPWGRFEWNGMYGQKQPIWTQQLKKKLQFKDADDGVFFLSEDQVLMAFCYFSISMIRPTFNYSYYPFETSKTQEREDIYLTFHLSNPAQLNLRVTQPFKRMIRDQSYNYSPLIFETGRIQKDGSVTYIDQGHQRCYWGAKSCHYTEKILQKQQAGNYFVRVQMLWKDPAKYHKAVLVAYSEVDLKFERLSESQGVEYWRKMLINYAKDKPTTNSGKIKYSMNWMRGQLVLYASTNQPELKARFGFDLKVMSNAVVGFGAISDRMVQIPIRKGSPNIGTVSRVDISLGVSTGGVQISSV